MVIGYRRMKQSYTVYDSYQLTEMNVKNKRYCFG